MALEGDVRPDLIGDDDTLVGLKNLHSFFQLPPLPDPAGGIMGRAEDSQMDVVGLQLGVHVLVVHTPDPLLIQLQRTID